MSHFYTVQFVIIALMFFSSRPSQELNDASLSSLITSNETLTVNPALDCMCRVHDAQSTVNHNASLDRNECLDGFDLFLSAYSVPSTNTTKDTCNDTLQMLPRDYCGYPDDPEPFSLETPPKICSSTTDKEKCSFETFRQPNTPCYWAEGRPCYWNSSAGECQGVLSTWFTQAYGLSSNATLICSKQRTRSTCRNTFMLEGHCTSWTAEGEDSNRVCAAQVDRSTCMKTTFSVLRACSWQERTMGWETTFTSCCNSAPYHSPLAGAVWCANIGLNYVPDGRVSANIGASTCDDIAGKYIRYHQNRDIFLDLYGPAYVSIIDKACCRPSEMPPSFPNLSPVSKPATLPIVYTSFLPPVSSFSMDGTKVPSAKTKETFPLKKPSLISSQIFKPSTPEQTRDWPRSADPSKVTSTPAQVTQQPATSMHPSALYSLTQLPIEYPTLASQRPIQSVRPAFEPSETISDHPSLLPMMATEAPSAKGNAADLPQKELYPGYNQIFKPSTPEQTRDWPRSADPSKVTSTPGQVIQQPVTSMQPSALNSLTQLPMEYPTLASQRPIQSMRPDSDPSEVTSDHPTLLPMMAPFTNDATTVPLAKRKESKDKSSPKQSGQKNTTSLEPTKTLPPVEYPSLKSPTTPTLIEGTSSSNTHHSTTTLKPTVLGLTKNPSYNLLARGAPSPVTPSEVPKSYIIVPLTKWPSAMPSISASSTSSIDRNVRVGGRGGGKSKVGAAAAALIALPLIGFLGYKRRNAPQDSGNDVKLDDI